VQLAVTVPLWVALHRHCRPLCSGQLQCHCAWRCIDTAVHCAAGSYRATVGGAVFTLPSTVQRAVTVPLWVALHRHCRLLCSGQLQCHCGWRCIDTAVHCAAGSYSATVGVAAYTLPFTVQRAVTVPLWVFILKIFIAQTGYSVCTRINYKIVPVTNLNKY